MPRCVELEFPIDYVADQLAIATAGYADPRAVGWHVTALIKASKEIARGKDIDPNYYYCSEDSTDMEGLGEEIPPGILEMGNLWEAACRPAFSSWCRERFGLKSTGPVQIGRERIVANADALVVNPRDRSIVSIVECKFRFSENTMPIENDDWMRQVKAYCHMLGLNSVWMVIGNVRQRPPGSASRVYMMSFSDSEVAENWNMLQNIRTYLDKLMGITGDVDSSPQIMGLSWDDLFDEPIKSDEPIKIDEPTESTEPAEQEPEAEQKSGDDSNIHYKHNFTRVVTSELCAQIELNCCLHFDGPGQTADVVCVECGLKVCVYCADHLQQLARNRDLGIIEPFEQLILPDIMELTDIPF